MKKALIRILKALLAVVALGGLAFAGLLLYLPGITPKQAARILVHDRKFGGRSIGRCIFFGDRVLPHLKNESDDYAMLDERNSSWVAEVLGSIRTEASLAVVQELYSRPPGYAKLAGATGLSMHGKFTDSIDESSFLVQCLRGRVSEMDDTQIELAAVAAGHAGRKEAVPYLLEALDRRHRNYWINAHLAEALGAIGDQRAVEPLKSCMKDESFYALRETFGALIALGEREAVPLAIARITPEGSDYDSAWIVAELSKATGRNFGHDRRRWETWWAKNEKTWIIPTRRRDDR